MHAGERGYVPRVEEAEKKEEDRSRRRTKQRGKKLAMRGRKGEDGETRRKKVESGMRKARRRSPMEAKVYDASPAGVTDATTEALFQVGFLASCASLAHPFLSLPSLAVGYTYVTTLGTRSRALSPVSRLRYTLSAVTM